MANAPKAPTDAPTQTQVTTGKGTVAKTEPTFQNAPGKAPQPPSAASTQFVKSGPSVDYHTQQGSRVPADINRPHDASPVSYDNTPLLDQQSQQMQDKGGA